MYGRIRKWDQIVKRSLPSGEYFCKTISGFSKEYWKANLEDRLCDISEVFEKGQVPGKMAKVWVPEVRCQIVIPYNTIQKVGL